MTGAPRWPVAELDPVRRLRVLAASLPHVTLVEDVFDEPWERVWGLVGDLESGVPRYERGIRAVDVVRRESESLEVLVHGAAGVRMRMDVVLRPGWCVMHSRFVDVGMAAAPEGDGERTRFAHFEGSPLFGRLARPYFRQNVAADLVRIARLLREDGE